MLQVSLDSKLVGVRGAFFRLVFASAIAFCIAIGLRGTPVPVWFLAFGLSLLAFGSGVATLWSP